MVAHPPTAQDYGAGAVLGLFALFLAASLIFGLTKGEFTWGRRWRASIRENPIGFVLYGLFCAGAAALCAIAAIERLTRVSLPFGR
jgi:hypothetical protein